jgi:drug/metabolite transporter (DMT)-like permease
VEITMTRSTALGGAFVLIWSSGYVVGSIASRAAAPLAITFWRLLLAGTILTALAFAKRVRWPRDLRVIGGIGLVGALLFGVQFGGVYVGMSSGMPAGTSALIVSACPLVVAVVQGLLGAERLTSRQWIGAGLGMTGVVVALAERLDSPGSIGPVIWTIVGLAGFAAATVLTPRLVPAGVDMRAATAIQCFVASVVIVPWALVHGGLAVPFTTGALGSAAWLTVVNGVGGSLVILALVHSRGATRTSSLLFVVPAVTAIASWPVLGEPISPSTLAGLGIAGAGIWLVQRDRTAAPRRPRAREAWRPAPRLLDWSE